MSLQVNISFCRTFFGIKLTTSELCIANNLWHFPKKDVHFFFYFRTLCWSNFRCDLQSFWRVSAQCFPWNTGCFVARLLFQSTSGVLDLRCYLKTCKKDFKQVSFFQEKHSNATLKAHTQNVIISFVILFLNW